MPRLENILILSVVSIIFNICESALVGPSSRCALGDVECERKLFQYIGSNYAPKGIPEIGVPILDPIKLQDVVVSFRDVINVTLIDGVAEGISDCIVTKYVTDIKTKTKINNFICDPIVIKGYYKLTTGSFLRLVVGNSLNSEGYIEATFENWIINASYPFKVEKHENGDIYLRSLFDKTDYDQSFGNIKVLVSNITVGDEDTSKAVVKYTNANWKTLIKSFGRYFGDKSLEFFYDVQDKFFNSFPAKYYFKDDLTSYVDKEGEEKEEEEEEEDEEEEEEDDDE